MNALRRIPEIPAGPIMRCRGTVRTHNPQRADFQPK